MISITRERNDEKSGEIQKFHGKYVLITSLYERDELNIWKFYNVIRSVEETFHVLKTEDGDRISIRQSTKAEEKLSTLYSLLDMTPHPLGKIKSVVHLKPPSKINTT